MAEAGPSYNNFLTGKQVAPDVLQRLRATREPAAGQPIQPGEADLFSYWSGPQEGSWRVLDVSGGGSELMDEWAFLVSIGAGLEQPAGRFLVRSSVVDRLYGDTESALFAGEGTPTEGKLQRTAQFLKAEVLPLYVARAQRLLPSIPDTTYDGIQLRANLRNLQLLISALEARFSAPPAEAAAP